MWRIPVSLIAGGGETLLNFTSDTWVGDLWTYIGSPALPVEVSITADGCDVGGIYVSANFAAGSTFQCTAINGGRFIGKGGDGGTGADDLGSSTQNGGHGFAGGHAISSEGFTINVDVDDGFLFGGGGGGGGAAGVDLGATADAGGGGGGGIGFTGQGGFGGEGGNGSSPSAKDGLDGSSSAVGAGGSGGGTSTATAVGGDGGFWGEAGKRGYYDGTTRRGGSGGIAGNAFAPISGAASVNFNGTLTESQLRSSGRVLGETVGQIILQSARTSRAQSALGNSVNVGFAFESDGELNIINTVSGGGIQSGYYWRDTINATGFESNFVVANYEILREAATRTGTWDNTSNFASEDTWLSLSASPQVYDTSTTISAAAQLFKIRRTTASGGSGEPLAMGYYVAERETFQ